MSSRTLADQSLVVIGGTGGLGLSAARAFVREGARVVVVGRDVDRADRAERELGEAARAMAGDATRPDCAERAVRLAVDIFGRFDGLYHVAGGSGRRDGDGPLHELRDEGWTRTIEHNLDSVVWSNRAAVRELLRQGRGGVILNMGSVLGEHPSPRHFSTCAYAAAKAAIVGLTRSSAAYYAPHDIRFNVIAPALTETPMALRACGDDEILRFIRTKQPLDGGRVASPEDVDAAAVFFFSAGARFVTGQVLAVDGGWTVSEGQYRPEPETGGEPEHG